MKSKFDAIQHVVAELRESGGMKPSAMSGGCYFERC